MTPITAPPPTTAAPDAIDAPPGQAPVQQPATGPRPGGRDGPLRSGNPRGNPNLAPRCGAKARRTGCACRAPAMANGRCRLHGGKSTGARTAEGLASLARAHTKHGNHGAAARVEHRAQRTMVIRSPGDGGGDAAAAVSAARAERADRGGDAGVGVAAAARLGAGGEKPGHGPLHRWCRAPRRGTRAGGSWRGRGPRCAGGRRSARPRGRNGRCWRRGGRGSNGRG